MKTKLTVLACALLFAAGAYAQTEVALVKTTDAATATTVTPSVPAPTPPSYCNYQVTSISGTCHNVAVGDVLCKECPPSGTCQNMTSCTKGDCTVNVTLVTSNCSSCLFHGHHAHAW